MFRLPALSPELLEALLAHVTYEEARSLLLPACKRLLALCGAGSPLKKDHHLAFSPPTPHFELRKTLRRIEYHWGFHAESRKLEAMARLLHELHGRGVVRLEQDPVGAHLAQYAGTDLRTLRCIFGFHVLDVLDNEAWFSACLRFAVDNDMLHFGGDDPYVQVKHMLQTLGLTGSWHVRLQCDEVIDSRWRFGDTGYYPYTKRHRALMRVVDAARQDAARQAAEARAAAVKGGSPPLVLFL
jgi:hypothetical protein